MTQKIRIALVIVCILMIGIGSIANTTKVEEPSDWAKAEVTAAIEKEIVPLDLQNGYQESITRAEYIALAVSLYEATGAVIKVQNPYPFTDIFKHPYNEEIVKAYNAKLVNGYTDGTFKPDAKITRQEVTMMLVNLMKVISPEKDYFVPILNQFSDSNQIGKWALDTVNYCFNNGIMKGVGVDKNGLSIISPLGNTTREQSIMMIYRIALSEEVFTKINLGTIVITEYDSNQVKKTTESAVINDFARFLGKEMASEVLTLSKQNGVEISYMTKNTVTITFEESSKISISRLKFRYFIELHTPNIKNESIINTYKAIIDKMDNSNEIDEKISELTLLIQEENRMQVESTINQEDTISINKSIGESVSYGVTYSKVIE